MDSDFEDEPEEIIDKSGANKETTSEASPVDYGETAFSTSSPTAEAMSVDFSGR